MNSAPPIPTTTAQGRSWRPSSIAILFTAWAILQIGGLFTPGLLDDVDSVYIQIAREMLQRHDFVTPTIDGIRFFDKPPLMYWMAAGSMRLFGIHDWAARIPLALGVLALLLAVYALGIRFYGDTQLSPSAQDDRAGLYAALAMATCIGPYLYTRFYIPDILIALWMTLSVHLFLIALDRINPSTGATSSIPNPARNSRPAPRTTPQTASQAGGHQVPQGFSLGSHLPSKEERALAPEVSSSHPQSSALWPCLGFAAVTALNLLTKGFIGVVFPLGFVLLYLAFTHRLKLLSKLHLIPSTFVFLVIAAPWHILAALRNPPIPMPSGVGLPARAGWAWFYLYNEHIARFLGRRIPHDYGQVPIPLFWLLLALWLFPWVAFLPSALIDAFRTLRSKSIPTSTSINSVISTRAKHNRETHGFLSQQPSSVILNATPSPQTKLSPYAQEAALTCLLWAGIILGFFTLSSRQEYYHLPALPALALLVGGLLAAADAQLTTPLKTLAVRAGLRAGLYFLVPLGTLLFLVCGYLALVAPSPHPGTTLNDVLSSNPAFYNLSLGHVFDLTTTAMGFFRGPLLTVALCMLVLGPIAYLVRRTASKSKPNRAFAANLLIAAAMIGVLLAAHVGLVRFYPILGSKDLAVAIDRQLKPNDLILIDGELTSGSTLLFYTPQRDHPVMLVDGRVNGPWFGSFWPGAPNIFPNDAQLHVLWAGPNRIFLLTYHPTERAADLAPFGPIYTFATSGGKTILTNRQ